MADIQTNVIHCGDNLAIMEKMPDESVDLIYLDPPFFSGRNYDVIWEGEGDHSEIRSFKDTEWYRVQCPKCDREVVKAENFCSACGASLEDAKVVSKNDIYAYIDWMVPRIKEMHRILKPTGSIYLHCDHHAVHYLKIEMDRIFGIDNFKTQITWRRCHPKGNAKTFANNSDYVLYYTKGKNFTFNIQYGDYSDVTLSSYKFNDHDGRGSYSSVSVGSIGNGGYEYDIGYGEKQPSSGYRWKYETMMQKIKDNLVVLKIGKVPRQKRYLSESKGVPFDNVWTDIENVKSPIYPTEKPVDLLNRIILSSSNPGDIVFDPFCGCATTTIVAKDLHRRYIGIDVSWRACKVIAERLKIPIHSIKNMPLKNADFTKMEPMEFQQWACDQMEANNVMPGGGADGGVDGIVRLNLLTTGYEGGLLQVKRSKNVGVDKIDRHFGVMSKNNVKKGFIVALSFSKGAKEAAAEYTNSGKAEIILVKAEDIAEKGYFKQ